jgi:hypothetical protein
MIIVAAYHLCTIRMTPTESHLLTGVQLRKFWKTEDTYEEIKKTIDVHPVRSGYLPVNVIGCRRANDWRVSDDRCVGCGIYNLILLT